jgi:protein TonB
VSQQASAAAIIGPGEPSAGEARDPALPWLALAVSLFLHATVALLYVVYFLWPDRRPDEPPVVPVQVVYEPPPPAPAPSLPAVPPPPPDFSYRESGPGERTVAPPPAETQAPEEAAPPPAARTEEQPLPAAPPEKPTVPAELPKPKPRHEVARLEPPKHEAETLRGPHLAPQLLFKVAPGEHLETGDPYLNLLRAIIERHRVYPRVMGEFGLPVEGTAIYDMALDRSGKLLGMRLARSSGTMGIDEAAAAMLRDSQPFPPPPANFPTPIEITISLRLFPPS